MASSRSPTRRCGASSPTPTSTTAAGSASPVPATGGRPRRSPITDGPLLYRTPLRGQAPAPGERSLADLRRHSSTKATCGSTAPTSATPRATSSRTPSRSPSSSRRRTEHVLAVEVACAPPDRQDRQAQHHRRLPALGLPRPGLEPRRHLATGARRARPGPVAHPRPARAVPRGDRRAGRSSSFRADARRRVERRARSDASRHGRAGAVDARARAVRSPRGENHVEWTVDGRPARRCGGRGRSAPSRCTTSTVEASASTASRATGARCAPGCAACELRQLDLLGQRRAHVPEGLEPRAHAHGARRGHAGRARARRAARQGRRPRPPARPRARRPARAVRRRRRGGTPAVAGLAAAVGLRPRRPQAGRAPGRARRSTCSATTRRSRIWCGHNEPMADRRRARRATIDARRRRAARSRQMLPTWNKTSSTARSKRALEQADGTRPVDRPLGRASPPAAARRHRQPPLLRLVPRATSATSPRLCATVPRLARFVTEFGAQAVPDRRDVLRARAVARPRLGAARPRTTRCRSAMFDRYVPPADYATFDDWRRRDAGVPGDGRQAPRRDAAAPQVPAHRRVRAVLLRRRHPGGDVVGARPRPRRRSSATDALRAACQPVIVVADRLPSGHGPGKRSRSTCTSCQRPS